MRFVHRLLVYALVSAIMEGISGILLYSLGGPTNPRVLESTAGALAFLIFLNAFILVLLSFAVGAATHSTIPAYALNPVFWAAGGIMGMFIIVTIIGEGIIWLRKEISEGLANLKREIEKPINEKS